MFTVTPDLNAAFPAKAARELGWTNVPLMCAQEIDVPGAIPFCIRVMLLVNLAQDQQANHIYLGKTTVLREDIKD
ncbi:chorismate mutase [Desulfonispora thiosulfatigenes DSM 11270]|uniref:chorismate mutase n=1 Tax=Desulfonispora thiosulfatigenes DSM 11270 TaxID=656914 RepID=A0A1W1V8B1_DESTI|nr:chorismate mutase [Desulfonispora thiosulfatigenes DSM 11270]